MLSQFPNSIQAGLSFRATISAADFPAPIWTVSAILRGLGPIDLNAIGDAETHIFAVTSDVTKDWAAGLYQAAIRVSDGTETFEIEAGQVRIQADLAQTAAGHDPRGHAQRTLDAIEAVIERRASKDQQSYTINGRTLVRTSIAELLDLRERYRKEVALFVASGRPKTLLGRQIKVRF